MLTDEQRKAAHKAYNDWLLGGDLDPDEFMFAAGIAYAQTQQAAMIAQARAHVLEEAAKVCEELAQQRSYGAMDRGDQEAWCEASGMNECGKAIRARKDGQ